MAAAKTKSAPVGSAQWIQNEREQASQFVEQEVEEFGYSVRNELEWLNEHMSDILNANQLYVTSVGDGYGRAVNTRDRNFADIFKTPGKLRGKTPRTTRKRDATAPRQPLTDIFAPNGQVTSHSPQKTAFYDKVAHFQIAEDAENKRPSSRGKSPLRVGKPGNTDSGYHGMTEDEMEVDARTETATSSSQQSQVQMVPLKEDQEPARRVREGENNEDMPVLMKTYANKVVTGTAEDGPTSDESFMSAKEDLTGRNTSREQLGEGEPGEKDAVQMEVEQPEVNETPASVQQQEVEQNEADVDDETSRSPSDASSPEKPLQRKSSFTFAALPAREPLTAKNSIGGRNSQIDARNSVLGRSFGGKSFGFGQNDGDDYAQQKPEEARVHNKSSTQLLHERITLLGKTKEPRPSKSIPQSALQAPYPQLPTAEAEPAVTALSEVARNRDGKIVAPVDDEDDDWIAPSKAAQAAPESSVDPFATREESPVRPPMHHKSISATVIPSPNRDMGPPDARPQKAMSVSNLSFAHAAGEVQSTTPAGSPVTRKFHEGPISASKNKLWSALKSAKNIFASSASASAAAKLEAHNNGSPAPNRSPKRDFSDESKTAAVFNMPGAMYSERQLPQSPMRPMSILSKSPSKKTLRSSNESDKKREKELKAQQKAADELEKAREKERLKAVKQHEAEAAKREKEKPQVERPGSADSATQKDADMPPPPPPKSMLPAGKLRAPGRLMRPTREPPPPAKPAPVSIRVASQSQRLHQAPPALNKSQYEAQAPPPPPKTGLRTASAQGSVRSSTAPNNARVKALEAAARRKEADEKAAQKKAEQKRELERKRAAKVEEERRIEEERKAAEQARVQEAKLAAQRKAEQQAAEARKREQQRLEQQRLQEQQAEEARQREQQRFQQQRQHEEAQKSKAAHELAEAIKRERAAQHPRGDVAGGTIRQLTGKNTVQDSAMQRPAVQMNPAKPAKRGFQAEDDEQQHPTAAPQRPGVQRGPPSYQQEGSKRRRTNEEQDEAERHIVMAPPKRPSGMRKVSEVPLITRLNMADADNLRRSLPFNRSSHMATPMLHRPPRTTRRACSKPQSRLSTKCNTAKSLYRAIQAKPSSCPTPGSHSQRTPTRPQPSTTVKPTRNNPATRTHPQAPHQSTKPPPAQPRPPKAPSPRPCTPKATTSSSPKSPQTPKTRTTRTTKPAASALRLGSRRPLSGTC